MQTRHSTGFHELTVPWSSRAGGATMLRGRRTAGPGSAARPMVHFLPGNGFCGGVYWTFLRRLVPDFGLFLHDIEGHGESEAPARFSGVGALTRRVPQIIRDQGLTDGTPLIGMGHSFGAAVTLKVAADNPGLFRALILLDPIVFPTPVWLAARAMSILGLHPMSKGARQRRAAWPSRDAALNHLRGRGIYRGWPDEALANFVDHAMHGVEGEWRLRCPPELEAQIYEHPVYPWPSFRKAKLPILFLHGQSSYPFFPPAARLARRANPGVVVDAVPGAHCFMLEHPTEGADAVRRFLAPEPGG